MGSKRFLNGGWVERSVIRGPSPPTDRDTLGSLTVRDLIDWIGDDLDRARRAWSVESRRDQPRDGIRRYVEGLLS